MSTTPTDHELIDRLLVLPAGEIRYDSLSTSTLSALATQLADPFIATSALGELAQRGPQDTKDAAENILDRELWDRHLTAFALTLLYDRDPESGIRRMESLAPTCADPKILTAMIENILSDPERFRTTDRASLARVIAQRVAALDLEEFNDVEQRDKFLSMFGNASA